MKQKITIEIEANVTRHDYYPYANGEGCHRCVLYTLCVAINNLNEHFPHSFNVSSSFPCRQGVQSPDRKYFKFKG